MKILALDIETAPNLVYTWGLRDQNIGLNQIVEPGRVLCVAAQYVGEKRVHFYSEWGDGDYGMAEEIHRLIDEADVLLHYNGDRFDLPWLRNLFLECDLGPTAPIPSIDLYKVVRSQFRFPSNKLAYVAEALGIGSKEDTGGFDLWPAVMGGDRKAQRKMERYCKQDTRLLPPLYERLLPWIPRHPNTLLFDGATTGCPACGASGGQQKRGLVRTQVSAFQQYQCQPCGRYYRGGKAVQRVGPR
jgi:DNA polymerase elongation subunit (family B)